MWSPFYCYLCGSHDNIIHKLYTQFTVRCGTTIQFIVGKGCFNSDKKNLPGAKCYKISPSRYYVDGEKVQHLHDT